MNEPVYAFDFGTALITTITNVSRAVPVPSLRACTNTLAVVGALLAWAGVRTHATRPPGRSSVLRAGCVLALFATGAFAIAAAALVTWATWSVPFDPVRATYGAVYVNPAAAARPGALSAVLPNPGGDAHGAGLLVRRGDLAVNHVPASAPGPRGEGDEDHDQKVPRMFRERSTGRALLLRGVNVGGSTKLPTVPDGATARDRSRSFAQHHRNVSFVGRPFAVADAPLHFARLRSWGFTFCRFLITWEAVEHEGPGIYDHEYLDYLSDIVDIAAEHGITVYIDPHQDVWSRWTGGDGAPGWTLEAVGFRLDRLAATGAAFSHQEWDEEHLGPYPQMVWSTNYGRLAAATMFTLFFAGDRFAPNTMIEGVSAQEYLQSHYLAAMRQVAVRLRDKENVVGFDTLNEPSSGYVGLTDISAMQWPLRCGPIMTPFLGMVLGAGFSAEVDLYDAPGHFARRVHINGDQVRVWRDGYEGVWRENGVWEIDESGHPRLLRPHHFAADGDGVPVRFMNDHMRPFFRRFVREVSFEMPGAITLLEPYIFFGPQKEAEKETLEAMEDLEDCALEPHWYDLLVLFLKQYVPWLSFCVHEDSLVFGYEAVVAASARAIQLKQQAALPVGQQGSAAIIGEVGIPYDLERDEHGRAAAYESGDFSAQREAVDRIMRALERTLASFSWWCYTADNSNQLGDLWNQEDLSVWSADQVESAMAQLADDPSARGRLELNAGGRALETLVRPYARKTAGTPLRMGFEATEPERRFSFEFLGNNMIEAPTEIFVPHFQYPAGYEARVSDGTYVKDEATQTLFYYASDAQRVHSIVIYVSAAGEDAPRPVRALEVS